MVIDWDLVWFFRHKNVYDVRNDLSDNLDFLFFKENLVRLLESKLITQFLKIFNNSEQFFMLIENDILELILGNVVQHAQQN
jgi:hypothetical protein